MSIKSNFPTIRPSLLLDFANSRSVDPRITVTRASTATRINERGVLETVAAGVPRIDFDPVTLACKGWLIEESRTNLVANSQEAIGSIGTAVTPNAALAPDGTMSMDLIYEDTTTGEHFSVDRNYAATAGTTYCFSVFIKDGGLATGRRYYHRIAGAATTSFLFDPTTQVVSGLDTTSGYVGHGVIPCGSGVFRVWIAYTAQTSTNAFNRPQLYSTEAGAVYTGDGASGIYIWGAQLEVGSFPTSYIPTAGAAVTRAADIAVMTGSNLSSWYRQDEGTFVVDYLIDHIGGPSFGSAWYMDSDTANRFGHSVSDINKNVNYDSLTAGVVTAYLSYANAADYVKSAFAYRQNDMAASTLGAAVIYDTSTTVPYVNSMDIGGRLRAAQLNGHIRRLAYYPKRLTNAELVALTTP